MARRPTAFTLVELVLVMFLLVTLAAIAIPSLSRSIRGHALGQEADRMLALTMYARDEAASQGVPFVLWVDVDGGRVGVEVKPGFGSMEQNNARASDSALDNDLHLDPVGQGMTSSLPPPATAGNQSANAMHGGVVVAEFAPDGTLDPGSLPRVRIVDRSGAALALAQTSDGNGYEIVKDAP